MQEVFGAVKFMHDNGVVHRDLKVLSSLRSIYYVQCVHVLLKEEQ